MPPWITAPERDGDFGKSICIATDCGDDADCTATTLGAILGIIQVSFSPLSREREGRRLGGNKVVHRAVK